MSQSKKYQSQFLKPAVINVEEEETGLITPKRPSLGKLSVISDLEATLATKQPLSTSDNPKLLEKSSQTDWWLTDAPKLEHGINRTFNASSAYKELDRIRNGGEDQSLAIELDDIKDTLQQEKLATILKISVSAAFLLFVFAFAFFIQIIIVNVALDSTEYLKVYNENHIGTLLWMFLGIIHPVIVGIYCCYALKHIHSLRPFYYRVTFFLVVPIIVLVLCVWIMLHIHKNLGPDLVNWMKNYFKSAEAKRVWDKTQFSVQCCGILKPLEWSEYTNVKNITQADYPDSCCISMDRCIQEQQLTWTNGCLSILSNLLNAVMIAFIVNICGQIILQLIAIFAIREFYKLVRHHIAVEPSFCKIITAPCGFCCSAFCKTGPTTIDNLQVVHESFHNDITDLRRDKYGDLKFKDTFPFK